MGLVCATPSPHPPSLLPVRTTGEDGEGKVARVFLLLGDLVKVGDPEMMDSFTLYLHEPGQFWPR